MKPPKSKFTQLNKILKSFAHMELKDYVLQSSILVLVLDFFLHDFASANKPNLQTLLVVNVGINFL